MKKNNLDVIHIYAGTSGSAGTYLNSIYNSLQLVLNQDVFVSYYYPFDYGRKIFYRFSDLSSPYGFVKKHKKLRYIIRYIELILSLTHILFFSFINRVKVANYNLTSDLNVEYLFLILLKLLKIKVAITCHDVIPFGLNNSNMNQKIRKKKRFFNIADYLLVHNENSRAELCSIYDLDANKILMFPFPLMDLKDLPIISENVSSVFKTKNNSMFRVGMVGHFREEKGLDILLKAWDLFYSPTKEAELLLVGNFPNGIDDCKIDISKNIHVFDQFVDDSTYVSVISNCDLIVLPYKKGTNSGIPSSVISLNTLLVASDIGMFKNNILIKDFYLFHSEDVVDLKNKIEYLFLLDEVYRNQLVDENAKLLRNYSIEFDKRLCFCYQFMLN